MIVLIFFFFLNKKGKIYYDGIIFGNAEFKKNEFEKNLDALISISNIANYCSNLIGGMYSFIPIVLYMWFSNDSFFLYHIYTIQFKILNKSYSRELSQSYI